MTTATSSLPSSGRRTKHRRRLPNASATANHAAPPIAAMGAEAVERLVKTIAVFDDFCLANDPHDEHDFGCFDFDGVQVAFKIDYFDRKLEFQSPNAADPAVTKRVITLMLASEY